MPTSGVSLPGFLDAERTARSVQLAINRHSALLIDRDLEQLKEASGDRKSAMKVQQDRHRQRRVCWSFPAATGQVRIPSGRMARQTNAELLPSRKTRWRMCRSPAVQPHDADSVTPLKRAVAYDNFRTTPVITPGGPDQLNPGRGRSRPESTRRAYVYVASPTTHNPFVLVRMLTPSPRWPTPEHTTCTNITRLPAEWSRQSRQRCRRAATWQQHDSITKKS